MCGFIKGAMVKIGSFFYKHATWELTEGDASKIYTKGRPRKAFSEADAESFVVTGNCSWDDYILKFSYDA